MPRCLFLSLRTDRSEIASVIRDLGVEVDEMNNGADAMSWLDQRSYEAIIIESNLPKEYGWDFAIRLKPALEQNKKSKVFLLCDSIDEIFQARLERTGITCVGRPIYDLKMRALFRTFKVI
ncbi:hypothetical protein A2853_00295 [Candidatus Kaiserbacteria bacterium RIFCSPHIGHO2_01_FULL_55_17]|uniref:Response regulatory domain-containing protein n=1 Tax=Candidatus Kaiserbacteria bacterium RIFCSPHIGHO2_01_FULL_55_17 TaxID=1798484 RepID=A0A1F6DAD0_9BACT|nr:MAG: hypothetical protein A2853_00295 [Candidatus Kaiserbacteria bacterium RIFCSPHIGHO2_01_FULL_55_17]